MKHFKFLVLVPAVVLAAACGRNSGQNADDALKNDLALASQAQAYNPQQFMSPAEMGAAQNPYGYPQQYQPVYRQPVYSSPTPVRRVSTSTRRASSSSGSRVIYEEPTRVVKNTKRDAVIGAAAGAVLGAVTSRDKVKGAVIGGVAGGILGAVIGNNVDIQRRPY
jgi:hypothetical protein